MIKEGHEWKIRELSEAALEVGQEWDTTDPLRSTYDAAYSQGVGEVLRFLLSEPADTALQDSEDVLRKIYERYLEQQ